MPFDSKNDWTILKLTGAIPKEIAEFLEDVFQIVEIRERVGTIRGIKFEVRTREQNHNKPHVHAEYDKYSISIGIEDGEILAGNLPLSQTPNTIPHGASCSELDKSHCCELFLESKST